MSRRIFVVGIVGLMLAACGGTTGNANDEETVPESTTVQTTEQTGATAPGTDPDGETIEVTADDYVFNGIPETVTPGTGLTLTNRSDVEVHEMVLVRIDDDETRSVEELVEAPEEEVGEILQMRGVMVALPGEEGVDVEQGGDTIAVEEPGRYAVVCFIPQGADPEVVRNAMEEATGSTEDVEQQEQPDLGEGTPHAFLGMVAEFQVEG